jgi:hypothetical protein
MAERGAGGDGGEGMNDLQKIMQELARVEPDWFRLREIVPNSWELVIARRFYYRVVIDRHAYLDDDDAFLGTLIRAAQARGWHTGHASIPNKWSIFFIDKKITTDGSLVRLSEVRHENLAIAAALALLEAHGVRV